MLDRLGVFIINLDRCKDRWAFMMRQLEMTGLAATRITAIDRRSDTFVPRGGLTISRDDVLIETNWDGRHYVVGEEACFQSHLKALAAFRESGKPFGLILEDDAEFAPDIVQALEAILGYRRLWQMVKLEGMRRKGRRPVLDIAPAGPSYQLVASLNPASGGAAYLVTQEAAARLIERADGVFEPFDNFLSNLWRHNLVTLDCAPFPVRQALVESSRNDPRGPTLRSSVEKLDAWQRHVRADTGGRYLSRWRRQMSLFGGRGRLTLAPWSRVWPVTPQQGQSL